MDSTLTLYHGSQFIIEQPIFGKGNRMNDYGLGFYCTESLELAKEWACSTTQNGYANRYTFQFSGLKILNLSNGNYHILNWLSILLMNRRFSVSSNVAVQGKAYLTSHFLPPYTQYDVIIGYRADDSYFSFASAFLNNTISLEQLERAMLLGKLGEQIVLKSKSAFAQLRYEESILAEQSVYFPKRMERDQAARAEFRSQRSAKPVRDAVYMLDILREEWTNDDTRLRRTLFG